MPDVGSEVGEYSSTYIDKPSENIPDSVSGADSGTIRPGCRLMHLQTVIECSQVDSLWSNFNVHELWVYL